MDSLSSVMNSLPSITDTVVYGSLAFSSAALYAVAFMSSVGTYYRSTHPMLPASKALLGCWALAVPAAALWLGVWALCSYTSNAHFVYDFVPGRLLIALLGTPLLLWPAAVALTSSQAFREAQMVPDPAPGTEQNRDLVAAQQGEGSSPGAAGTASAAQAAADVEEKKEH